MAKSTVVNSPPISKEDFNKMRVAFANRLAGDRPLMFRTMADALVPGWFEWHDWTNRVVDVLCRKRWASFTGCSGSAKTYNVSGFACMWWLAAPHESSVILCSTTMKMLRKRGWAEVQKFQNRVGYGNFVDSRTVWQNAQGDEKHAIFGIAVQEGNLSKVADNIKGIHTKRQMVIIDEATAVPAAIWDACTNLYRTPIDAGGEFILVALGNARTRLDQFGRFIEPERGWDSVSIEVDEWEGKARPEDGKRVSVSVFNFKRSPNITSEKPVSKWLPTKRSVEARMKALKDRNLENDPSHWSNDYGFPPPEGLAKTVFTESLFEKYHTYDQHQFTGGSFRIIGAYDQARTGDRPALRFAAMGEIKPGTIGIELMPAIILFADATNKEPIAYQLLAQLRNHCSTVKYRGQTYSCDPENLGIDCSNEATFGDLCQREWNPKIIRIMFGAGASPEPASHEDERPCNEVYRNKRAEMFFRTRSATETEQLRGMDKDTAAELTSLEYSDIRPDGTSKPITIQDKAEYKAKYGASCDLADCAVMILEVARQKGFGIKLVGKTAERDDDMDELMDKSQSVYNDSEYYQADNEEYANA